MQFVVVFQVPGDGVWSVVEAFAGQGVAQLDDQVDGGSWESGGAGVRPA